MAGPEQIRIVVADDHPIYREGIARAIASRTDMRVVRECQDGDEAFEAILRLQPEVAVLDARMPGKSTVEIIEHLTDTGADTRTLILSGFNDEEWVRPAIAAGAHGYMSKETVRDVIMRAIVRIAQGETVIGHEAQAALTSSLRAVRTRERSLLTDRELECLRLTASGLSSTEIADRLIIGHATVKSHLHSLYGKLQVGGAAAAVAEGMRRGLIR